jgi:hypothetical protein
MCHDASAVQQRPAISKWLRVYSLGRLGASTLHQRYAMFLNCRQHYDCDQYRRVLGGTVAWRGLTVETLTGVHHGAAATTALRGPGAWALVSTWLANSASDCRMAEQAYWPKLSRTLYREKLKDDKCLFGDRRRVQEHGAAQIFSMWALLMLALFSPTQDHGIKFTNSRKLRLRSECLFGDWKRADTDGAKAIIMTATPCLARL